MKLEKFKKITKEALPETREEVRLALDIQDRIHELLEKKFEGKQKLLAEKMGVTEASISKWLSGIQNFTISTIAKLSIAFGEPLIAVCTSSNERVDYEKVTVPRNKEVKQLSINEEGRILEAFEPVVLSTSKSIAITTSTSESVA